ncbi:hypothetical protein [Rhizorhabdus dicambivorans]|uniref:Uncharacterized protein n=1 Tax=Rhizorhabdus dicambivorans TaxID=1850238 RepID=A0A2A4G3L3_9SPHN|nr:hypothetical protein [Rhizorhabdus dicambivorans]PCE44400.1 hypothetical protein COO09_01885 [Rhizorhabdus dicambivorans]
MGSCPTATALIAAGLVLAGCNMRGDQAGPNSSEEKVGNTALAEPVDRDPISSTPGAAPDDSQVEPRDPVTR